MNRIPLNCRNGKPNLWLLETMLCGLLLSGGGCRGTASNGSLENPTPPNWAQQPTGAYSPTASTTSPERPTETNVATTPNSDPATRTAQLSSPGTPSQKNGDAGSLSSVAWTRPSADNTSPASSLPASNQQSALSQPSQLSRDLAVASGTSSALTAARALRQQSPEASQVASLPPKIQPKVQSTQLRVTGVRPNQGPIRLAVFTDASSFPEPKSAVWTSVVESRADSVAVASPQSGRLAVAAFQDVNNDGQLNRNRFGIPLEPFAFSNNARGQRGPPDFEAAAVETTGGEVVITLP